MPDQWMSIVEYARTFSISDMTIRRRIKSGKIHAVLREGKYYIPVKMTETGKLIPQRKATPTTDHENEHPNPRETLSEQSLPKLVPRQLNISPNQNATSQQSAWNQHAIHQRSSSNIEPSDHYKPGYVNDVLLTANGESRPIQKTELGTISSPPRAHAYNYNISPTQASSQVADSQVFSQLSHKIESMISLTRDTLGRLDREKIHFQGEFEQKILAQQEQLKNRDMEVQNLKQKLEDMQLLIKIMEAKQSKAEM